MIICKTKKHIIARIQKARYKLTNTTKKFENHKDKLLTRKTKKGTIGHILLTTHIPKLLQALLN